MAVLGSSANTHGAWFYRRPSQTHCRVASFGQPRQDIKRVIKYAGGKKVPSAAHGAVDFNEADKTFKPPAYED